MPAPGRGGPTPPAAPISQTRTAGRYIPAHILPTTGTHTLPTTLDSSPRPPPPSPLARHNLCHHAEAPSLLLHRYVPRGTVTPPHCNCIHAAMPPCCSLPCQPPPEPWPPRELSSPRLLALQVATSCKGHPGIPRPPATGPIPPRSPRKDTPLSGAALLLGNMGPLFWDSGDGTGLQRGTLHLERDS